MIELGFADEECVRVAAEQLAPIGATTPEGRLLRVNVADGATAMLEIVRVLDQVQLAPTTMALREPTLDDVFLELTGHAAEEPTGEDGDGDAPPEKKSRRGRRSSS